METLKERGAIVASVAVAVFALGWSVVALTQLGTSVEFATDGKTVELDQWSRAFGVFTAVLPLLTTIVGFWVGVQGKEKAEKKATDAQANEKRLVRTAPRHS